MHLKTLGGLELSVPSKDKPLRRPKPLLLLAYLAIEGPKERHHLAELFWPDAQRPLDSLRVALSQLRMAAPGVLHEVSSPGAGATVATEVDCDAVDLLGALDASDSVQARELYAGEFLAGFYLKEMGAELEEWVLATREHLASGLQLARIGEAERLARGSAFAEASRLAAETLDLLKEPAPEVLSRLHRLLLAASHPSAADVGRQASYYGVELADSTEAARTALAAGAERSAPTNLPFRVAPFVGRDMELVTLTNVLASGSRLVTVTGVGGVGKSRLALEAASTALHDGLFGDGVFLVELAAVADHRYVLDAVAAGVDAEGGGAGRLADFIGERRILLLLDNFEHVSEAAVDVARLLEGCRGLTVLATSRLPLDLAGEQLFHLNELEVPPPTLGADKALTFDAVRLFQAVARRARLSFTVDDANRAEVVEICRLVHGLPLGIELAAAWAGRLAPAELASALRNHLDDLLSGPRDAAPRQRSLRATIEHSWSLLSDHESRALTRLAAFRGGFTHQAAMRVAGASLATLSALAARSLLNAAADARYDLHPLVAYYARERLEASGEDRAAALAAHAEHFVELALQAEEGLKGGDQAGSLGRLEVELPNIHAAQAWLVAQAGSGSLSDARAALALSGALWQYWLRRGRLAEGRRFADAALKVAPSDKLPAQRAKALTGAGVLAFGQGDDASSAAYNLEALEIRRREGDRLGEARSLYNLSATAGRASDFDRAQEYVSAAIEIFRELGDRWSVAFALNNLSVVARHRGRDQEAIGHLEERLRLQAALQDELGMAETHTALGLVKLDLGDLPAAEGSFGRALDIASRLQDFNEEASALEGLALVAHERGLCSRSGELFLESSAIRELHGLGPTAAHEKLLDIHGPGAADIGGTAGRRG